MARPGKSLIFPDPGSLRDKYYAAADEEWRTEKRPARQSRFKSVFEEPERQEDTRSKLEEILEAEEDVELQGDRQAKDHRMEEGLEAVVGPSTSTTANDAHDEDNESLNDTQGSIVRSTCEQSANGSLEQASNGAHRIPVDSNCEAQFLDGAHEEPDRKSMKEAPNDSYRLPVDGNLDKRFPNGTHWEHADCNHGNYVDSTHEETADGGHDSHVLDGTHKEPVDVNHEKHFDVADEATVSGSPNEQLFDETHKDPVVEAHQMSVEGTRKKGAGKMCEEFDGGTRGGIQPSTDGEPVSGCHDEPLNNDNHEATVTGTIPDSGKHHAQESPSEPQPDPPKRRGKPKYKRLLEFDNLRPTL